jgi:cysteine desulfuration protein SufE
VIDLTADSDSAIVKGLAAVLLRVTSGQTPQAILRYDIEGLLNRLELGEHLSMNRRNGLRGMIQHIKAIAEAAQRAAD